MKFQKKQISNLVLLIVLVLLIIPQTRLPIQVFFNKGLAMFSPTIEDKSTRSILDFRSWQLQDLKGRRINFKDLKGRVVVLNFWATWCPPCIAELPYIKDLAEDYRDKIEIILVSNEATHKVESFFKAKDYDLNSYLPLSNYPNALELSSIPRTLLISKNGEIVIDKTGAANWSSKAVRHEIEILLKE
ncbi:MAG: TlpA family protein disulfide reductase [Flavobacteriaceae bacterium]|nr:TlpA family protein disulfide reductase [Flavobacteriaceae bacterium]